MNQWKTTLVRFTQHDYFFFAVYDCICFFFFLQLHHTIGSYSVMTSFSIPVYQESHTDCIASLWVQNALCCHTDREEKQILHLYTTIAKLDRDMSAHNLQFLVSVCPLCMSLENMKIVLSILVNAFLKSHVRQIVVLNHKTLVAILSLMFVCLFNSII